MVLFKFRAWPGGPNVLSAGLYRLHGSLALVLFPLHLHSIALALGVTRRAGW